MERFDPREHTWTKLESMNMKRGSHSMVVFNEKMYAWNESLCVHFVISTVKFLLTMTHYTLVTY